MRNLAVSAERLGNIQRDRGDQKCIESYRESIGTCRRIKDNAEEAVIEINLGNAYYNVPDIRDLDAAEAAYQRSLNLRDPNDALGRSRCIQQIGMVHHGRFREARKRQEPVETLQRHAQAAENHYLEALRLCPKDALIQLAPTHGQLGNFYDEVGQRDNAREHFEEAAQYFERAGNRFNAGQTRFNMAVMYVRAAEREDQPSQHRASLLRAQAYAEAGLRDFQHYQGRAATDEADAQALIDQIKQGLARLPQ